MDLGLREAGLGAMLSFITVAVLPKSRNLGKELCVVNKFRGAPV